MGASAGLAIFMKLMESEKGRAMLGKIPMLGSFIPMLQDVAPDMKEAIRPLTPEEQLYQAITVLSQQVPADKTNAEKFKSAVSLLLDGVSMLKESLSA